MKRKRKRRKRRKRKRRERERREKFSKVLILEMKEIEGNRDGTRRELLTWQ